MEFIKKLIVSFSILPLFAWAGDHFNLEKGVPLEVEDAFVSPYKNREFHAYTLYDHLPNNKDRLLLVPRLEIGAFKNFQFELATPFELGNRDNKQTRNIQLEGLYNINMEKRVLPAISLGGGVYLPTGEGLHGYDTVLKLNITKTLPIPIKLQRVHANIDWYQNSQPKSTERINRLRYVFGYEFRIGTDDMIITDFLYEEQYLKKQTFEMVELGWRHQYNPLTVLATGIGTGLNPESPDIRFNISIQRSLNLPY